MGIHFLAWGPVTLAPATRRGAYTLAFTVFERVHVAHLEFDFRVMRYVATPTPSQLPATGFSRSYTSGAVDGSGRMLLAGTAAGELAVYTLLAAGAPLGAPSSLQPTPLFKTALVASSNGVHAVCCARGAAAAAAAAAGGGGGGGPPPSTSAVFLGGGDGLLRCFIGRDTEWVCTAEARLPSRIVSISQSASATWLLVGTATGAMFRVAWAPQGGGAPVSLANGIASQRGSGGSTLSAFIDLLETSHTGPVSAVAFHSGSSEACATIGADASVRMWNLNDYKCSWIVSAGAGGAIPLCLWLAAGAAAGGGSGGGAAGAAAALSTIPGLPSDIYVGYTDGMLRCYAVRRGGEESGASSGGRAPSEMWRANAHRGAVTCITGNRAVVVTGGSDARVNVWSRSSRELLLSFADHTRPVVGVSVDPRAPEVIYSAGADRCIVTYNLRAERRLRAHTLPAADAHACTITALTQLAHAASERELLAGTSDGRIFVFDPDVPDTHAGAVDVLALLAEFKARLGAAGGGVALPAAKPGQARPELRINALAAAPSGRYLAVATACGRLIVMSIPALCGEPVGAGGGGAFPAAARRGPVNAGTYTDLSGTVRSALVSQAAVMRLLAVFHGRACYADVRWAPDERQLVAVSEDGCLSVFNFYGV